MSAPGDQILDEQGNIKVAGAGSKPTGCFCGQLDCVKDRNRKRGNEGTRRERSCTCKRTEEGAGVKRKRNQGWRKSVNVVSNN